MPRTAVGTTGTLPNGRINPLSTAVRAGDFVFVSGLMAKDDSGQIIQGDTAVQIEAVLHRLAKELSDAGCTLDDVVKCTVWLADAADFAAFNTAYENVFTPPFPARSAVRCDLLLPGARIELEAVCYRPLT